MAPTVPHTFILSEEERTEIVRLLEQSLSETRVEMHRTHTPEFRQRVMGEQSLLRGLLDKFHNPRVYE
jgi:hypothetical protein